MENAQSRLQAVCPPNLGWLQLRLNKEEVDFLWECVDHRQHSIKPELVGNISGSYSITDEDSWFFNNTLLPLCCAYAKCFGNLGDKFNCVDKYHPYFLKAFWVNYQLQHEFNPVHWHDGVYSFVIWLKIPTKFSEQNKRKVSQESKAPVASAFQFHYLSILGYIDEYTYEMGPELEGTLVFFPSQLRHSVYPFYDCSEERVSISGNIALNTST